MSDVGFFDPMEDEDEWMGDFLDGFGDEETAVGNAGAVQAPASTAGATASGSLDGKLAADPLAPPKTMVFKREPEDDQEIDLSNFLGMPLADVGGNSQNHNPAGLLQWQAGQTDMLPPPAAFENAQIEQFRPENGNVPDLEMFRPPQENSGGPLQEPANHQAQTGVAEETFHQAGPPPPPSPLVMLAAEPMQHGQVIQNHVIGAGAEDMHPPAPVVENAQVAYESGTNQYLPQDAAVGVAGHEAFTQFDVNELDLSDFPDFPDTADVNGVSTSHANDMTWTADGAPDGCESGMTAHNGTPDNVYDVQQPAMPGPGSSFQTPVAGSPMNFAAAAAIARGMVYPPQSSSEMHQFQANQAVLHPEPPIDPSSSYYIPPIANVPAGSFQQPASNPNGTLEFNFEGFMHEDVSMADSPPSQPPPVQPPVQQSYPISPPPTVKKAAPPASKHKGPKTSKQTYDQLIDFGGVNLAYAPAAARGQDAPANNEFARAPLPPSDPDLEEFNYERVLMQMYDKPSASPFEGEDEQVRIVKSKLPPELPMLGNNPKEICYKCFRAGHAETNSRNCPVGRIENHHAHPASRIDTYVWLDRPSAKMLFEKDIGDICDSLSWILAAWRGGVAQEMGVSWPMISMLQKILQLVRDSENDPVWTLNGVLSTEGRLAPDPASETLEFDRIDAAPQFGPLRTTITPTIKWTPSVREEEAVPARKKELPQKKFPFANSNRPIIGGRPNAECTVCWHPGHTKASTRMCPAAILKNTAERLQSSRKKFDNRSECKAAVEILEHIIQSFAPEDTRPAPLVTLIANYRSAVAQYDKREGKKRAGEQSVTPSGKSSSLPEEMQQAPSSPTAPPIVVEDSPSLQPVEISREEFMRRDSTPPALALDNDMRIIGNRPDTSCKWCLHRGHDQRAKACPYQLVAGALDDGEPEHLPGFEHYVRDLEDALAWNAGLPAESRADVAHLRDAVAAFHAATAPPEATSPWRRAKRQKRLSVAPAYPTPPDLPPPPPPPADLPPPPPPLPPLELEPCSPAPSASPAPASQGLFVDHTRMGAGLLMQVLPFIIKDGNDYGALLVDHTRISPLLLVELAQFVVEPGLGKRKAAL